MSDQPSMSETDAALQRRAAAFAAVRRASLATEAARRRGVEGIAKADASPVTIADFASQAIVVRLLRHMLGHADLLGEESAELLRGANASVLLEAIVRAADAAEEGIEAEEILEALEAPRADPRRGPCWALDPVDGTKGFLRGGQYAIALAWLEEGAPRQGALCCPRLDHRAMSKRGSETGEATTEHAPNDERSSSDERARTRLRAEGASIEPDDATIGSIAVAAAGGGAFAGSLGGGPATRLLAPPWQPGETIRMALSVEAAHGDGERAVEVARTLGPVETIRLDSAAKYLLVASGRANAYVRIPRDRSRSECVWDHAAGVLLAAEAGCLVCDLDGKPLDFSQGPSLTGNRGIVVAPPRLAEALLNGGL